jgi:hypothetical protein
VVPAEGYDFDAEEAVGDGADELAATGADAETESF